MIKVKIIDKEALQNVKSEDVDAYFKYHPYWSKPTDSISSKEDQHPMIERARRLELPCYISYGCPSDHFKSEYHGISAFKNSYEASIITIPREKYDGDYALRVYDLIELMANYTGRSQLEFYCLFTNKRLEFTR